MANFAIAPARSAPPQLMSQGLQGQCRQVNENTFLYRTRSLAEPLTALTKNERVILGEETGRNGWIAVTSPTTGFVQTRQLAMCNAASAPRPVPSPLPPPPPLPQRVVTRRPRPVANPSCRRVTYPGDEGLTVRSGPGLNYPRIGGVSLNNRVRIDANATRLDGEGRQWLRLLSPVRGWSSNGLVNVRGSNFSSCL